MVDPQLGQGYRSRCLHRKLTVRDRELVVHGLHESSDIILYQFSGINSCLASLKSFCSASEEIAVLLRLDIVSTISFLNRMGVTSQI